MSIEVRGVRTLLQVFDMPSSVHFYRDVLGFEIVQTSEREGDKFNWGVFRLNGAEFMLNTAYEAHDRPGTPEGSRARAHRDTCLYFSCPDPEGAYQYLRSFGIDVKPPTIAPYGMKQLYVSDPDGYELCFQWPAA